MRERIAAVLLVLATAAGCGTAGERPPTTAGVTGSVPRPLNVRDPADVPSAGPAPSCNPRASLRATGALPAPGHMPPGTAMARIAQRGRLVVGIDQNAYLVSYRDPKTGELVGFEIDLARDIAAALLGDRNAVQFRAITTAAASRSSRAATSTW